ncbi:MAG: aminotransferase class V-fold PLP-dependent enzyme [Bacteroidia bacterium]
MLQDPFAPEELVRLRADTPGTARVVHLNNAGSALPPQQVVDTVAAYLTEEALLGGYELMQARQVALDGVRDAVAGLIGAQGGDEIALLESATMAWYMAFRSLNLRAGDVILTAESEYVSNYLGMLQAAGQEGVRIRVVPSQADGTVDLDALDRLLGEGASLLALTHMPSNGGLVQPAEAVGALARKHGVCYLLDACQSVGQYPVDVAAIGCDLLSTTGRKFLRAPRGTGFLYVRRARVGQLVPPFPDGFSAVWTGMQDFTWQPDARRFEHFEHSRALRLGLGVAAHYAQTVGIGRIWQRVRLLADTLRAILTDIPGVVVEDRGNLQSGIVTFTAGTLDADEVQQRLLRAGIHVSVARIGTARLDMEPRGLHKLLRASVHYYNTTDELHRLGETLTRWCV